MACFNLVEEDFVPVLRGDERELVSLATLLTDAHAVRDLAPEFPSQFPALLRQLILPVVWDAVGVPHSDADWGKRFQQAGFSRDDKSRINDYLAEHRDRFDLFGETIPFGQVNDLTARSGETKPVSLLIPAMASGNNVPLFSGRTEADAFGLTPAEAALWLVHAHCWDTAAIKTGAVGDPQVKSGKTTGNPTGPLGQLGVLIPVGHTMYETIMLNTPIIESGPEALGTPQWRRPPATAEWESRAADGLLDLVTWQSRRIRLFLDTEGTDDKPLVTRVVVAAGDRLTETPDYEPHTAWRIEYQKKGRPAIRRPRRHIQGKAVWRGLGALLALSGIEDNDTGKAEETSSLLTQIGGLRVDGDLPEDYPLQVNTYGLVYGTQSAVVDDAIADALPLPVAALTTQDSTRDVLLDVAQQAEDLATALNRLAGDLRRALGADPIPWDKGQRPGDIAVHGFDRPIRRLFAGLRDVAADDERVKQGCLAWELTALSITRAIAESVLDCTPPAVFTGREKDKRHHTEAAAEKAFFKQLTTILTRVPADQLRRGI